MSKQSRAKDWVPSPLPDEERLKRPLEKDNNKKRPPIVFAKAEVVAMPMPRVASHLPLIPEPISLFHRIWPVAGLAATVIVNVAWMGFLGYGFFKLVGPAFFWPSAL